MGWVDSRSNIASACGHESLVKIRSDVDAIFRIHLHLSLVSTPTALSAVIHAPSSVVGWYQRCADYRIFTPCSLPCVHDHVPIAKNFKFTFA